MSRASLASSIFSPGPISSLSYTNDFSNLAVICNNHSAIKFTQIPEPHQLKDLNPLSITSSSKKNGEINTTTQFTGISFPDVDCLYATDSKGTLSKYDPSHSNKLTSEISAAHSGTSLTCVQSLSSKSNVVTAAKDGIIKIWDSNTHQPISKLLGHRFDVRCLSLPHSHSHNDNVSVVVSGGRDRTIKLWDISQNKPLLFSFTGHTGWVHDVSIKLDKYIVSCSGDKTVRVWDLRMLQQKYLFKGHQYRIWNVDVSQSTDFQNDFIVSGSTDTTVRLWNINDSNQNDHNNEDNCNSVTLDGHLDSVLSVACNNEGSIILSGCEDGSLFAWSGNDRFHTNNIENNDIITTKDDHRHQPLLIDTDTNDLMTQKHINNNDDHNIIKPKHSDFTKLLIHDDDDKHNNNNNNNQSITVRPEEDPTYDKSAAELVKSLQRIKELENNLQDAQRECLESSRMIKSLKDEVHEKSETIKHLERDLSSLKNLRNAIQVNQILNEKERKLFNHKHNNEQKEDYNEPVNKISAVSDQLSKLAARLDAVIA